MKYLKDEPFTVSIGESKSYRDNWDRIFRKDVDQAAPTDTTQNGPAPSAPSEVPETD